MHRSDRMELQADGAELWFADWVGGPTLAKVSNCRLVNLVGDMRRTVVITGPADTWFSIPACCAIAGKRVRGYIASDDDGNAVFRHTYY